MDTGFPGEAAVTPAGFAVTLAQREPSLQTKEYFWSLQMIILTSNAARAAYPESSIAKIEQAHDGDRYAVHLNSGQTIRLESEPVRITPWAPSRRIEVWRCLRGEEGASLWSRSPVLSGTIEVGVLSGAVSATRFDEAAFDGSTEWPGDVGLLVDVEARCCQGSDGQWTEDIVAACMELGGGDLPPWLRTDAEAQARAAV
jgi:hypothetical protein